MILQPNHNTSLDITEWLPDTSVFALMTSYPQLVESMQSYHGPSHLIVGNSNVLPISLIGHYTLIASTSYKALHFHDILIVPKFITNLHSVAKFVKFNSCLIEFNHFWLHCEGTIN